MQVSTQITEKDKKLLIFMAAFVMLMGFGWFLIRPALQDISELNGKIAAAQITKRSAEYQISQIPVNEAALRQQAETYAAAGQSFYRQMKSQEIDSLLTLLALDSGFQKSDLRELTIDIPSENLSLPSYLAADETKDGTVISGFYGAAASFTLHGDRASLETFLDKLASEDSMRISGLVWKSDAEDSAAYLLTVQLQIVMTDAGTAPADAETMIAENS